MNTARLSSTLRLRPEGSSPKSDEHRVKTRDGGFITKSMPIDGDPQKWNDRDGSNHQALLPCFLIGVDRQRPGGPDAATEHAVKVGPMPFGQRPDGAQHAGHGAMTQGKDRAQNQNDNPLESWTSECYRERKGLCSDAPATAVHQSRYLNWRSATSADFMLP